MGALTLKSFPFELRGWETKTSKSVDPTDSFSQNIMLYLDKNQIIKVEPIFVNDSSNNWLTDKGRHFFDGLFFDTNVKNKINGVEKWESLFEKIKQNLYSLNIGNLKKSNKNFFIIIYEYLSMEVLNLLIIIAQTYTFIKLRRAECYKISNHFEFNFQLSSVSSEIMLFSSSLCFFLGINTRYENSHLNLTIRKRHRAGNFSVVSFGPIFNSTYFISFVGTNYFLFWNLVEGNLFGCRDFKFAKNPILITNTEIFKRYDSEKLMDVVKTLKFTDFISNIWNGFNTSSSCFNETGLNYFFAYRFLRLKDLITFNLIYTINVKFSQFTNLNRYIEYKLLNFINFKAKFCELVGVDQNSITNNESNTQLKTNKLFKLSNFFYFPNSTLFENDDTFINSEGFLKRTTKVLSNKKRIKSNWKLLRNFLKSDKIRFYFSNSKSRKLLIFNVRNVHNFKNFMSFHYLATQLLTDLSFYLNKRSRSFVLFKKMFYFKTSPTKLIKTRLKYWLDDFYNGGKDSFSSNSLVLIFCSKNLRLLESTFF